LLDTDSIFDSLLAGIESHDQASLLHANHKGYLSHFLYIGDLLLSCQNQKIEKMLSKSELLLTRPQVD
jgi:hypothetical protein